MSKISLHIIDEVNCLFDGLLPSDAEKIIEKTKLPVKGAFTTSAYKLKIWDGKESLFREDGFAFQFMLDEIFSILEKDLGYNVDRDIDIIDDRDIGVTSLPRDHVDDSYLLDEIGYSLRDHQEQGMNLVIDNHKGILDFATNSGKSFLCIGISKYFDPYLPSLVATPSEQLAKQTFNDYMKSGLDCVLMHKGVPPKKRQEMFEKHRHIIITTKLLLNCLDYVEDKEYVLIVDEAHIAGDVFLSALRLQLANCPIRVGLTGSVPPDKLKLQKIKCHLGGDVLGKLEPIELIKKKQASEVSIKLIRTDCPEIRKYSNRKHDDETLNWDWTKEFKYLTTHDDRVEKIAQYIKTLDQKNTLVLCHPQFGPRLCKYFNDRMIVDETPVEQRREWLKEFDSMGDGTAFLCASYDTSGTGLSHNFIHRVILIDVGANETRIKQTIGRGMRLDGVTDSVEVVDISDTTKYSNKHHRERKKLYNALQFDYTEDEHTITVESGE